MRKRIQVLAVALAGGMLLSACGGGSESSAADGETTKLKFVIAAAVLGAKEEVAVLAVADEMGYFEEEGLEVTSANVDGSVAAIQAVASGSGDITAAEAGSILAGAEKNVGVSAVGGLVQNWPWSIATLPGSGVSSAADLKGKKIGVISLASGSAPFARAFVEAEGLDPDKDVELLPVGVGAQAKAALEGGQVDVLALYSQAYAVLEAGGTTLEYLDNPDVFDGIRSITFAASDDAVAKDPEVYEKFLRASYKAMLFSAVNPEAAMRLGYEKFPQILAGGSAESKLDADVLSLTAWLETATPAQGEAADFTDWGATSDDNWSKTQAYTERAGQIKGEIDLQKAWNPDLLEAANDFDSAAVVKQATDWKP